MSRHHKSSVKTSSQPMQPPIPIPDALRLEIASLETRAGKLRHEAEDMKRDNAPFLKHSVSKVGNARRNDLEAQGIDNFITSIENNREYRRSVQREATKKLKEAEECERKAGEARRQLVALESALEEFASVSRCWFCAPQLHEAKARIIKGSVSTD
ncbi:hypothetical protein PENSPDRAFT_670414 [Peniophora sp. CONT]|nr:hypothetical protein PENSPDRAFT_670414 [Peniophora sp. CONT]